MKKRGIYFRRWIVSAVLLLTVLVQPMPAAGPQDVPYQTVAIPEITGGPGAALNGTALEPFQATPAPVRVIHLEVSETSLPGPRYMAFGPSAIDVSIPPVFFVVLVVLGLGCIGAWGLVLCREGDTEDPHALEKPPR